MSLKICVVAPGSSAHTKRWVETLHDRGHRVLLVVPSRPFVTRPLPVCAPYDRMGWRRPPKLHYLISYLMIRRAIRRFRPDLVHMHYLSADLPTFMQVRHWPRFVVSVWGSDIVPSAGPAPSPRSIRRKMDILGRAHAITATTGYLADQLRPLLTGDQEVHVVPFGVDTTVFRPPSAPRDGDGVVIGFVKHYTPNYGPDVLIRSMVQVRRECPNARLWMAGFRDPKPYHQLALHLGLADVVSLHDAVEHERVAEIMRTFDIFCMPSLAESFGVAAIEASACEVPVVASNVGGVSEAVIDGETGLLVPPANVDALAAALIALIKDPHRRRRLGTAGRRFVQQRYEWADNVTQMEGLYDRVMSHTRLADPPVGPGLRFIEESR